ncbi:uncharacterized protein LOC124161415 [Ischnura elegans]|uniref:uncharacterized protein LOC124161415 n=1 Tax=Ischnura elegans TaxID=197161 RepID=UPI001ED8BF9D|nr:uncharacterized protein LOC124161415 [Ischnura elegans]
MSFLNPAMVIPANHVDDRAAVLKQHLGKHVLRQSLRHRQRCAGAVDEEYAGPRFDDRCVSKGPFPKRAKPKGASGRVTRDKGSTRPVEWPHADPAAVNEAFISEESVRVNVNFLQQSHELSVVSAVQEERGPRKSAHRKSPWDKRVDPQRPSLPSPSKAKPRPVVCTSSPERGKWTAETRRPPWPPRVLDHDEERSPFTRPVAGVRPLVSSTPTEYISSGQPWSQHINRLLPLHLSLYLPGTSMMLQSHSIYQHAMENLKNTGHHDPKSTKLFSITTGLLWRSIFESSTSPALVGTHRDFAIGRMRCTAWPQLFLLKASQDVPWNGGEDMVTLALERAYQVMGEDPSLIRAALALQKSLECLRALGLDSVEVGLLETILLSRKDWSNSEEHVSAKWGNGCTEPSSWDEDECRLQCAEEGALLALAMHSDKRQRGRHSLILLTAMPAILHASTHDCQRPTGSLNQHQDPLSHLLFGESCRPLLERILQAVF